MEAIFYESLRPRLVSERSGGHASEFRLCRSGFSQRAAVPSTQYDTVRSSVAIFLRVCLAEAADHVTVGCAVSTQMLGFQLIDEGVDFADEGWG